MNPQDRIHSPQDEDRLLQYLDGQLPVPEAHAVEAHLAACPECQALRRQWAQLDERLAHTLAQPRLSPDFAARLRQQIAAEAKPGMQRAAGREMAGAAAGSQPAWLEARRHGTSLAWLGLLDVVGYGVLAAVGGYCLFRLALAWIPSSAATGTHLAGGSAFLFGMATAAAALLFSLNLVAKNRPLRWLGAV
jgi:anti-sigma factor RsiW